MIICFKTPSETNWYLIHIIFYLHLEGSFVRHKSLDSATINTLSQSGGTEGSGSDSTANQTLEQLIAEKRRQAAEKLQRHRAAEQGKSHKY